MTINRTLLKPTMAHNKDIIKKPGTAKQDDPYGNIITIKFAQAEQPKFIEKKGTEAFIQFGVNNDYPDYLLGLYNESPKHGAIIKGKSNYIFGKGFEGISQPANTTGETWNNILKKSVLDDEIFAGYYLQIIYNLAGEIKDVYHIEFYKVRTNKDMTKFYVKNDWTDQKEKSRCYPAFNNKYDPAYPSQILYVHQYNPKANVYPLPSYFQGLNYIDSDVQVSRHILGNAKDGFVATTLISLNNGEPASEEAKEQVEKRVKKKFTGSEGDRIIITFNKSKDNAAEVTPLSNTMLTKEDFTNINNLIQQEVFASHQVTSPMLFGIKTEGQLGGRTEIQEAYEIFNNTYVNERQQAHEELFNKLFALVGIPASHIVPVEPLGFTLKEESLLKVMPREYFLDKMAVDQKYYPMPSVEGVAPAPAADASGNVMASVNSNLTNLTGKQFQGMQRIVKKYKKGDLTRDQAAMLLKSSFGISDEEVALFLDADSGLQFASQEEIDFSLLEQFGQVGEPADLFEEMSRVPAKEQVNFAEQVELTQLESDVLNLIGKDKRVTPEVIAKTLNTEAAYIRALLLRMVDDGILTEVTTRMGQGVIITERTATQVKVSKPTPSTVDILLRYKYDGPKDDRNRPFCAKLMELNRVYSRSDIETISERLGYSVWDRRGGWLTMPDGTHRPYCRHTWFAITVKRKSQ